jgi:hypothetical protein
MVATHAGMLAGNGRQVWCSIGNGMHTGLLVHRFGDRLWRFARRLRLFVLKAYLPIHQQNSFHFRLKVGIALFQIILNSFGMQGLFGQYPLDASLLVNGCPMLL